MKEEQFQKELLRRLNVLIALRLDEPSPERLASTASKVTRLINLGLSPGEVAGIIGKPANYVTAVLSTRKGRMKGKK